MNYSKHQISCDASMAIFTSMLSSIYAGYFRKQVKVKNGMKTQTILIVYIAQNVSIVNTTGKRILNDGVMQSC